MASWTGSSRLAGRVDIYQVHKDGRDASQLGQPLGLPGGQPRADHLGHIGVHYIVAELLGRGRRCPRTRRDVRGHQPHAAFRQPLAGTGVTSQLPRFGGEHHLTPGGLLLGQAALNNRPAGQQKLPTPTDPTDAEGHDLTGPDTDPQPEPEAIERLVAVQC
jgi:hypothetical protein